MSRIVIGTIVAMGGVGGTGSRCDTAPSCTHIPSTTPRGIHAHNEVTTRGDVVHWEGRVVSARGRRQKEKEMETRRGERVSERDCDRVG